MKVHKLIEILNKLPQDKDVSIFWEGGEYGRVDGIVNSENVVIVGDWSIYRKAGKYQAYPEHEIVYG